MTNQIFDLILGKCTETYFISGLVADLKWNVRKVIQTYSSDEPDSASKFPAMFQYHCFSIASPLDDADISGHSNEVNFFHVIEVPR